MTKSAEKLLREYRDEQAKAEHDGPAERWRKPVRAVAAEQDPSTVTYDRLSGAFWPDVNWTFDEDTVERIRQGRVCVICHEPQPTPFPKRGDGIHLPIPHFLEDGTPFDMAKHQTTVFEQQFEGEKWIGPTTSLSDEYERMLHNGKEKRHVPGSSILLPGKDF